MALANLKTDFNRLFPLETHLIIYKPFDTYI